MRGDTKKVVPGTIVVLLLLAVLASCGKGREADTTPPVISQVAESGITTSGATITWATDETATSQVEYGLTSSYGSATTLNTDLVTSHSISLSGLAANTTYHYQVKSKDTAGNLAISKDYGFATYPSLGQVYGRLVGNQTGQPVVGAALILGKITGEAECVLQAILICSTNTGGEFSLTDVPPAKYVVFYDPSGKGKDKWTAIDQLEINYTIRNPVSMTQSLFTDEFFETFAGGGAVTFHTGTSVTIGDNNVTAIDGAFTSQKYDLTIEFHDDTRPIMLEVKAGETTNVEIRVMVTQ